MSLPAAAALPAQSPLAAQVRVDNDAFDFWLPPWNRPDEEYTSGVEASLRYAGNAWWHRWLKPLLARCTGADDGCATRTFALGQQIYTGAAGVDGLAPLPGSRPSAGWLYVSEAERVATDQRLDETSLTVGVTGPPALGSFFQRLAHSYGGEAFNRPVDWWTRQLPFEPGFTARYDRTQRLLVRDGAGWWGGDIEPHAGGSLGTILTEAVGGIRARASFPATHPWIEQPPSSARLGLSIFGDASLHGVLRNEFLDGTFFRPSDHVDSRPWVSELQGGFTVSVGLLSIAYEVHHLASEYVPRPGGHTWASIVANWRFRQ